MNLFCIALFTILFLLPKGTEILLEIKITGKYKLHATFLPRTDTLPKAFFNFKLILLENILVNIPFKNKGVDLEQVNKLGKLKRR